MSAVVFTAASGAVTVTGNVVYGTDFFDRRLNQFELLTADGGDIVYDNGPLVANCTLIIKGVSYTDGDAFRTWCKTKIIFAANKFKMSAVAGVDLGMGKNTAVQTSGGSYIARYNGGQDLNGVLEYVAPDQFNITFPYRFTRE